MLSKIERWEIWNAYVEYEEDSNIRKERPVLIYNPISDDNIIAFKLTTHEIRNDRECEIRKWQEAGLKKETVIRIDKVLRLTKNNLISKIGKLQIVDIFRFEKSRTKY